MTSVNRHSAPAPTPDSPDVFQLLWAALQRAKVDGVALIAADADAIGPLSTSHARLLVRLPPDGARVTELAARAGITKQALGQLATQLADRGYVEMVPDPADGRAKLIRCTPRGERARRAVLTTTGILEDRWRARVGESRYAVFREVLAELSHPHDAGPPGRALTAPSGPELLDS